MSDLDKNVELATDEAKSENAPPKDFWDKLEICGGTVAKIGIPVIVLLAGHFLNQGLKDRELILKDRELSREWVNVAVGVLSDDSLREETAMREWAVSVVNFYVESDEIKIAGDFREQLTSGKTSIPNPIDRSQSAAEVVVPNSVVLNVRGGLLGVLLSGHCRFFISTAHPGQRLASSG